MSESEQTPTKKSDELEGSTPKAESAAAESPQQRSKLSEAEERAQIARYHDTLLTTSSILGGFSLTGLLGLPEVGPDGIEAVGRTLNIPYGSTVFPLVYAAMLFATISFLGVLLGITSFRLQAKESSLTFLRFSFRASVVVFGLGIGSLFTATVTMGVPSYTGFFIGFGGGGAIVLIMFYRAFLLQSS